jgi:hypothetical protein
MNETLTPRELITVKEAAQSLVNRLREIHADERYKAVWLTAANHNCAYRGPTYTDQLKALEKALACLPVSDKDNPRCEPEKEGEDTK